LDGDKQGGNSYTISLRGTSITLSSLFTYTVKTSLIPSFGADTSKKDSRTISHTDLSTLVSVPEQKGGYDYLPADIEHQHKVGICTAISLIQNAEKYIGRKFSPDFQYLLQKKYYDQSWAEGSSIFSALKVGKNYGFLPLEEFSVTEQDRLLSYYEYTAKLQAVPEAEIQRCINIASDYKLSGYANVDVSNLANIADAISKSKSGILCRYDVGVEWYTAQDGRISWDTKDINPLRPPKAPSAGHAITMSRYDNSKQVLANTWGITWNRQGLGDIDWLGYKPTEAWLPLYGLTEIQIQDLKEQLKKKLGLIQQLINLWLQIKSFLGKRG
jgi:hypothetical protein